MAQVHASSGDAVELRPLVPALGSQRTHAILKAKQLEAVHLILPAGGRLPEHAAPGEITLMGIEGEMLLGFDGRSTRIRPGTFVHLPAGVRHTVDALTAASALLTLCLIRPTAQPTESTERTTP